MNERNIDEVVDLNETSVVLEAGVREEEIEMSACWVQCGCNVKGN